MINTEVPIETSRKPWVEGKSNCLVRQRKKRNGHDTALVSLDIRT